MSFEKGTQKDEKVEWQATRYLLNGKMYAMLGGDKHGKPILSVKLVPMFGQMLRNRYHDIVPGYYMNKEHWNSLYLDGTVPDVLVREMLDQAYELVLHSLSKTAQASLQ